MRLDLLTVQFVSSLRLTYKFALQVNQVLLCTGVARKGSSLPERALLSIHWLLRQRIAPPFPLVGTASTRGKQGGC